MKQWDENETAGDSADELFARTQLLLGKAALKRLANARVAVAGAGGVGSFAIEALVRGGVGSLLLIDNDTVTVSNCNRQLHATTKTVGQYKTRLMAERARDINPSVVVETSEAFVLPDNCGEVLRGEFDFIVDAVDTVSAKIALVMTARERGIPLISVMGTGNKLDPSRFAVRDLFETSGCPLCRVMRRELRKREVDALPVVCSDELPIANHRPPGSISFVPPVAGMIAAGYVIRTLVQGCTDEAQGD
ncbi:tRNA threonylcarbamoyladenosine dehydratase [Ruminococcaceae bacterium OttesenSCG-928-L11]|nr:tRNA threonylcarbamoyladenosine dehydratase [Ruminococcaceae bacterium OttesenSCG-928-L11]